MTRFWITLEQGVRFVISCIERMHGGEVFVPKIPSMKVMDMADTIAPDVKKKFVGIRPGEKVNEILLTHEEARHSREVETYFVIEPEFPFWGQENFKEGKPLPKGVQYTSDGNKEWLTKEELQKMIEEFL